MLKAYIITVEDSPRIVWMKSQLDRLTSFLRAEYLIQPRGTDLNLIELAVSGLIKLFPMHKITPKLYDSERLRYHSGTLGCLLGHYRASECVLKNGDDFALILEDNAELLDGFLAAVSAAQAVLSNIAFDILHLFSNKEHSRRVLKDNVYWGDGEWGTAKAQIVSQRYAQFACANIPFHEVADGVTMLPSLKWIPTQLESFVVYPHPIKISSKFHSSRVAIDADSTKSTLVFRRIPETTCSFLVGQQIGKNVIFEYDAKMICINFGLFKSTVDNGRHVLSGVLTSSEIRRMKDIVNLERITPGDFIGGGPTIPILCDNEFEILSKRDFLFQITNNEFVGVYIRENIIPRIQAERLHNATSPKQLYENIFSPLRY